MNQMYMLLLGVLGIAAVGSLLSSGDEEEIEDPAPLPEGNLVDGTSDADTLSGTGAVDIVRGFEGDDRVAGGEGDDYLYGGIGEDTILGEAGGDHVYLGQGADLFDARDLDAGDDTVEGGTGADTIHGGRGDDLILAGEDDESDDAMNGGAGADSLDGGKGDDSLGLDDAEDNAADTLLGGEGRDTIALGAGDLAEGGEDDDSYLLTAGSGAATIAYASEDRLVVNYEGAPDDPPEVEVVQAGADAHVIVDGALLAVLKETDAGDVGDVEVVRVEPVAVQPPSYVAPVIDPEPVIVRG